MEIPVLVSCVLFQPLVSLHFVFHTPYIGESASAMLNAVLPPSLWFSIMSKKWWEDLLSSFPNVAPLGKPEDWESTRKLYVVEVVRAISLCGDINEGFIALVIKIASVVADAGHQASWMMEQLHGMYCVYCVHLLPFMYLYAIRLVSKYISNCSPKSFC